VLIVDDHPGMAKAISRLLAIDYDIVGILGEGSGVLEAAQRLRPQVIVLDVNLPDIDGLIVCRQITQSIPEMKVVVFTAMNDPDLRRRALEAGAANFVHKLGSGDDLLSAIRCLHRT
jgi:DNA-binding NarL/FixJ family response regulator